MSKEKKNQSDPSQHKKKGGNCCNKVSMRVKTYILLAVMFVVAAAIFIYSDMIPLVTMRNLEEKQAEVDTLAILSDFKENLDSFRNLAVVAAEEIVEVAFKNYTDDEDELKRRIYGVFHVNGQWNGAVFKNGFALYNASKEMAVGEFHDLDPYTYAINMTAREVPAAFQGYEPESKALMSHILKDEPFAGLMDKNETVESWEHYPFYFIVAIRHHVIENDSDMWLVLFLDERLAIGSAVKKLKICISDVPASSVLYKGQKSKDMEEHAGHLKGLKLGRFRNISDAGGSIKTLIQSYMGLVHEGKTMCYNNNDIIYEGTNYFGTTYFAIRDTIKDDPDRILLYVRFDHKLEIMTNTNNFLVTNAIVPSGVFLILLVVVIIIYSEVGILRRLDAAKKSLHQIILERKALLEEYLKDDKITRDYYSFSGDKGKEGDNITELLERIAADSDGSADELGVLMNMSSNIATWMEHILQDKLRRLDSVRIENTYYAEGLKLLSAWSRRSDVRFSPSYVSADGGVNKSSDLKNKYEVFSKAVNLSHILRNGIALEMFKSFCKASGHEASLYFILDTTWLHMMEEVLRVKTGGDGTGAGETSGSVTSAHGNVTHSQIVRLVQTIFSTYIYSPDHAVESIGLTPAAIKRLTLRADPKGRVKYAPGLFKSAATDVRHYIDTEVLPSFKESAHFRALFIMMNITSQITFPSSSEVVIYSCPFVHITSDVTEEEAFGEDEKSDKKKDDLLERLPLHVCDSADVEALVEEERICQKKNVNPSLSSLPSVGGQGSSRKSLPSSTGSQSQSGSRSKLRTTSPFAVLLPGAKRKASNADGASDDSEKKGADWVKKSFALTGKTDRSNSSASESSGNSEDE